MCTCLYNRNGILLDFATVVSRAATNGVPVGDKIELVMDFPSQNVLYDRLLWEVTVLIVILEIPQSGELA